MTFGQGEGRDRHDSRGTAPRGTAAILGIVWSAAKAVFARALAAVEAGMLDDFRHAAAHVAGVVAVRQQALPPLPGRLRRSLC